MSLDGTNPPRPEATARPRRGLRTLGFILAATSLPLGALEILARLAEPVLPHIPTMWPQYGSSDPEAFVPDPVTTYRFRPGSSGVWLSRTGERRHYRVNSLGCPDDELTTAPLEVLFLGDSCTFGEGLSDGEPSYVDRVERDLETEFGRPLQFLNAGIPGYSSEKASRWLTGELLALEPAVVVVSLGWNDRWWAVNDPGRARLVQPDPSLLQLRSHLEKLALYRVLRSLARPLIRRFHRRLAIREIQKYRPINSPERFEAHLRNIVAACRIQGAEVILMTLVAGARTLDEVPEWMVATRVLPDYGTFPETHAAYTAIIRSVAADMDVPLADADRELGAVPPREMFADNRLDAVHPDRRGHELLARILRPVLERALRSTVSGRRE